MIDNDKEFFKSVHASNLRYEMQKSSIENNSDIRFTYFGFVLSFAILFTLVIWRFL